MFAYVLTGTLARMRRNLFASADPGNALRRYGSSYWLGFSDECANRKKRGTPRCFQ